MVRVYFSRPFSGRVFKAIFDEDKEVLNMLGDFHVIDPLRGKSMEGKDSFLLKQEIEQVTQLDTASHAQTSYMFARDSDDVLNKADCVLCDLRHQTRVSIGCNWEMAWAFAMKKPLFILHRGRREDLHFFYQHSAAACSNDIEDLVNSMRLFFDL